MIQLIKFSGKHKTKVYSPMHYQDATLDQLMVINFYDNNYAQEKII